MFKKLLLLSILVLALISIVSFRYNKFKYSLTINNREVPLIIVDTELSRIQGLSNREFLDKNSAMLFVFDEADKHGIWMKDMKFSIDIIWLDKNNRIVHLENNISPNTYPTTFFPPEKSLYIIEANSDFIEQNNLLVGNILNIVKR